MGTTTTKPKRKYHPEPLTRDEVHGLLKACSSRAPTGIRDKALICVMWRAMLRVSEALALKVSDYDPSECTIRILPSRRIGYSERQG